MSGHTPGPWKTYPPATTHFSEALANERLALLAPEMFEFISKISRFTESGKDADDDARVLDAMTNIAIGLVAKATGAA